MNTETLEAELAKLVKDRDAYLKQVQSTLDQMAGAETMLKKLIEQFREKPNAE